MQHQLPSPPTIPGCPAQTRVLEHLWHQHPGPSPSLRDMAHRLGVSKRSIQSALAGLRAKGLVTWEPGQHRSYQVVRQGRWVWDESSQQTTEVSP